MNTMDASSTAASAGLMRTTSTPDAKTAMDSAAALPASDATGSTGPALFFLGANHHKTPIELREKLALNGTQLATFHEKAAAIPGLSELVVINTCNRIEFYGIAANPELGSDTNTQSPTAPSVITSVAAHLEAEFCAFQQFPQEQFHILREHATGRAALQHLLEVASGLNSQMLGETEILGQVKDAYAAAQTRRATGPFLNRVFQKTFQHAKYVRTHTAITEGQISVANVAVDLAQKIFGKLEHTRILLIGAGDIGEKTARAFQSRGAGALTIASRTLDRSMTLATALNATALPFEHVISHITEYDIAVCSTAAPSVIITRTVAEAAMKKRRGKPLFLIDLALPRDVESSAGSLENVFLYNLDDLARITNANRAARENEVLRAREILGEKAATLWKNLEQRAR